MRKLVALAVMLVMLAFVTIACGPPSHSSTKAAVSSAVATAPQLYAVEQLFAVDVRKPPLRIDTNDAIARTAQVQEQKRSLGFTEFPLLT